MGVGLTRPKARVAGIDAAGVVEAAGASVRGLRSGDQVLGFFRGAFAEYACAAADLVVPKPAGLTFEQAAAVPVAATTALRGIRDVGEVRAGQRVLVIGAGGGVGSYAVQIAAALGAEVTGVCSTRNAELVRSNRRRARYRLHDRRLHRRADAVRRDPRQREQPSAIPAARGAHPEGDPGA
jgi:NADPH:quinone reductase-like Zn-dependent oxidoreductase